MKKLEQRQKKLVSELVQRKDMIKGFITSVCNTCHRANCICTGNKQKDRIYRATYKDPGNKTKIVYVPRHMLKEMENRISSYQQAWKIINELVEVNIAMFKIRSKVDTGK